MEGSRVAEGGRVAEGSRVAEGNRVAEGSREPLSTYSINIIKATKKTKIIIRKS